MAEGGKKMLSAALRGLNTALSAVGIESSKVQSLGGAPQVDPIGETYYSVTPFRYGEHIAKFSLAPIAPGLKEREGVELNVAGRPDGIREDIRAELRDIAGAWEFRVQLCRDLERQPVEDPTVEWKEDEAPFARVGVIRTRPQDSWDPATVQKVDEESRFSIWTGLAAHQPLGNINRARRDTYRHSADFRTRVNGCPIHEPA